MVIEIYSPLEFDIIDLSILLIIIICINLSTIRKHRDYYPNRSGTQVLPVEEIKPVKHIRQKSTSYNPYRKEDKLLRKIGVKVKKH